MHGLGWVNVCGWCSGKGLEKWFFVFLFYFALFFFIFAPLPPMTPGPLGFTAGGEFLGSLSKENSI